MFVNGSYSPQNKTRQCTAHSLPLHFPKQSLAGSSKLASLKEAGANASWENFIFNVVLYDGW